MCKTKKSRLLFGLSFDKNFVLLGLSVKFSSYFNIHFILQFSVGDLCSYFLWSAYRKPDVKLAWGRNDANDKNWKFIHLQLNHCELKACSKIHVQLVPCLVVSVIYCIVKLNNRVFNGLKTCSIAWRYILVTRKLRSNRRELLTKQIWSNKKCLLKLVESL